MNPDHHQDEKEKVYSPGIPATLENLKTRIREECANINPLIIKKAVRKMRDRARQCVFAQGGHFEGKKRQ